MIDFKLEKDKNITINVVQIILKDVNIRASGISDALLRSSDK